MVGVMRTALVAVEASMTTWLMRQSFMLSRRMTDWPRRRANVHQKPGPLSGLNAWRCAAGGPVMDVTVSPPWNSQRR
jgi:hypothetical protein